jgi:drug/metabolite transporter (DMT)-like permease
VRIYRWSAVLIGFVGVIVMLIPHFDIGAYAGAAGTVAAVGCCLRSRRRSATPAP